MPSPALSVLRGSRLAEVRALLELRPERIKGDQSSVAAADAVNRASVVVLIAHLEGFVEDLVDDAVDVLNAQTPPTAVLPLELLAAHVAPELNTVAGMQDVTKRAARTKELFTEHAPLWLDATLAPGRLSGEVIGKHLDNPGSKQIASVLGLLGVQEVFTNIQLPDAADPVRRLNEMVGVRNSIAHGGSPSVADDKAWDFVDSVEAIGEGLERGVGQHVQGMCGLPSLPWS